MRRRARKGGGRQVEIAIGSIGGRGDGVGLVDGRPVFVPLTVAGDRVVARLVAEKAGGWRGEVVELLAPGPQRIEPPSPQFGLCGGCALQQLSDDAYTTWKRGLVIEALRRQGLDDSVVGPLRRVAPDSRRRASLAARREGRRLRLGFHRRARRSVVDLQGCLVLTPGLQALLPGLRDLLLALLPDGSGADVTVTETESGADLLVVGVPSPDLAAREATAELAERLDLARVSWSPNATTTAELLVQRRAPLVSFAGVPVAPPPGGFLQPTLAGEQLLVAAVLAALPPGTTRVADLFAGCGTFSFPLASASRVLAVEGSAEAAAALDLAARRAGLAERLAVQVRDLERQPLRPEDLADCDAAVFDPPRAGARAQAEHLAAGRLPVVVAVSCHPASFARDARILVDGGYRLDSVLPVDQFVWSAHVELVARFQRATAGE